MATISIRRLTKLFRYSKLFVTGKIKLGDHSYALKRNTFNQLVIQCAEPSYEEEMNALYRRELKDGDGYFLDIGANQGQTLAAILTVSPDIPYFGVEPQAICVSNIQNFILSNNLRNHRILSACLSNKQGVAELEIGYQGDVRASIVKEFTPEDMFQFKVPTLTLSGDALVKDFDLEKVQLIKIDVEGAEMEVLTSFKKTFLEHKPAVAFEILPNILVSTRAPLSEEIKAVRRDREKTISAFFKTVGYETFLLSPEGETPLEIGPDLDNLVRNYVARPKTK